MRANPHSKSVGKGVYGAGSGWVTLPRPPDPVLKTLKAFFTIPNPTWQNIMKYGTYGYTLEPPTLCYMNTADDYIEIPRGFDSSMLDNPVAEEWLNGLEMEERFNYATCDFPEVKFSGSEVQQDRALRLFKYATRNNKKLCSTSTLLIAPTASGKTLTALLAARLLGQKTLVICLTNLIKISWATEIEKVFGIPRRKIGLIQQSKYDTDCPIVLASWGTLLKMSASQVLQEFGTVIIDEVHMLGDNRLMGFVQECSCAYLLGLTATDMDANGKQHPQLLYAFGNSAVRVRQAKGETISSHQLGAVKEVMTKFTHPSFYEMRDWHELLMVMGVDDERNELIVEKVVEDHRAGYTCLVVTDRKAHVELLGSMLLEHLDDVEILTGERSQESVRKIINTVDTKSTRCIVATKQVITIGANINAIDRLHIATPYSSPRALEQMIGRIRRKHEAKDDCAVTYYVDEQMHFLFKKYLKVAVPTFEKLKITMPERYIT